MTAGVSAAAVSPEVADKSEATVVAGTSSSASVALALQLPAREEKEPAPASLAADDQIASAAPEDDEPQPTETANAAPDDTADDESPAASDEAETTEADETSDEPVDTAEGDTDKQAEDPAPVESAEADSDDAAGNGTGDDAADDETVAADATPAADGEDQEAAAADPVEAEGEDDKDPVETAKTPAPEPAKDEAPADTATVELSPPVTETSETEEEETSAKEDADAKPEAAETDTASAEVVETVTAAIAEVSDPEEEVITVEAAETVEQVKVPSHDASVVLEVSPPPEADTSSADSQETAESDDKDEPEETKIAALTPPSAPASPEPEEEEASEPAALDTAPSDDEKVDAEDAPAATEAETESTTEDGEADATESGADAGAETSGEEEAVAEEAGPPPPPPAHPVVAAIRAKLEEPDQYKGAAASDLKALKALYAERTDPPLWVTDSGFSGKAEAIMAEIRKADDWGLEVGSFDLPSAGPAPLSEDAQADAEIALSIAILSYARDAQIGRLTPSRVSKLFDQHPSLRDPQKVLTEMAASDSPDRYLLSLHPQHDQFKRLQQALVRARDSAKATGRDPNGDRRVQLIVINMERWRWAPRDLGRYHVWNNVPEFNVRVMKGGQPIYQEKTIVGQYQYATPFFSATMRNIVFHPNWTVPPTIIKEDLAPKLQGPGGGGFFGSSKEAVLRRYGLSANYKGKKIDADTVDWNNVNIHAYTFTQDPGPANVLGQFKFNFPNKHAIYMHDTPQRELFAERTRTLSHGCIRVNQPDRLAALLLSEDKGWSMGQVRSLVNKGPSSSTVISLRRPVPVHLTYFTAIVGENGQVTDFGDIYGIDNRMASQLFKNPASFPVPATPAVAEEGSSSRTQAQTQRRQSGGGFDNFISGLFGN